MNRELEALYQENEG